MLTAPLLPRRISLQSTPSLLLSPLWSRWTGSYAGRTKSPSFAHDAGDKLNPYSAPRRQTRLTKIEPTNQSQSREKSDKKNDERPLIEQLFPEETKRYNEAQRQSQREIPRLPLDATPIVPHKQRRKDVKTEKRQQVAFIQKQLEQEMQENGPELTLLVLRNATPNLIEEDFRRLIPQGKHVEGWTLERGDILQVIPGRNLATLEQESYYYLLFSSQLSAFAYQGQATRISRLAASHTPTSVMSVVPPIPGHAVDGIDAHAAIDSFALTPAGQTLELRQIKRPLSPILDSIIRYRGYPSLVNRPDRLPYELRLTLDGPQLQAPVLNHIFLKSATARASPWSGGVEQAPRITKWNPTAAAALARVAQNSTNGKIATSDSNGSQETELAQIIHDTKRLERTWEASRNEENAEVRPKGRPPPGVFILGFHTENAAQAFRRFWHRREMTWKGVDLRVGDHADDLPPIANVETLW
ncbi:Hypothetical protein R9X50_00576600 [Acrodontium crateriforme]|uniref:Uncharacterized protein n=1 Tax=Acrodontium crateriforme TaxID=150365 RepID=A0AAQ3M8L4_9PEZI|nr:Hypothetical protein R9X50_00576600 [Acrodontium crateriforme]